MRIAHIAPAWIPVPPKNYGGTENVISHLIEELVALDHEVTLFAPGDASTSAKLMAFFPRSLLASDVPWNAYLKAQYHLHCAVEYLQAHPFDLVHSHLSSTADLCLFPLLASLPMPHVTTLHSHFPFDSVPSGWIGDADQYYLRKWGPVVPLVAISQSAQAQAPQEAHFVGMVHHGVRLQDYRPKAKGEGPFFTWLGRFVPEKGAHLAIQVAREAGIPLVLAGSVQRHQQSQRYFHEVIQPQIDGTQVKYVGAVDLKQKVQLLSRARGLLNPITWEEPFGMVMIEAMALGCPVISFARGAAPELIVHGKTGFLVHDVEDMVRYIPRIAELDRDTIRDHVECHFSARTMTRNYVRIYGEVIRRSKAAQQTFPSVPVHELASLGPTDLTTSLPAHLQNQPFGLPLPGARVDRQREATATTESHNRDNPPLA